MNTEKTPLIQKLILGVLALIFVCLVILIAQNRRPQGVPVAEEGPTAAEPAVDTKEEAQRIVEPPPGKPSAVARRPQSVREESAGTPPEVPATVHPSTEISLRQPSVTIVNPVRPAPLDIVVHPQAPALKTELCGRVRLDGKPPPEVPIRMDATCQNLNDGRVTTRHYVVGPQGGLANVLVYIKDGLPSNYAPPPVNAMTVTVSRCFFEPYVFGVQTGQKFIVSNADRILHNVHATAKNNRQLNVALPSLGQKAQLAFDNPEVFVRLKCDVHAWEFCYVGIIPHPFFAVTDTNGVFCLPAGLPHGRYTLAAVHLKAGETLQEVIVQENLNIVELALTVPQR